MYAFNTSSEYMKYQINPCKSLASLYKSSIAPNKLYSYSDTVIELANQQNISVSDIFIHEINIIPEVAETLFNPELDYSLDILPNSDGTVTEFQLYGGSALVTPVLITRQNPFNISKSLVVYVLTEGNQTASLTLNLTLNNIGNVRSIRALLSNPAVYNILLKTKTGLTAVTRTFIESLLDSPNPIDTLDIILQLNLNVSADDEVLTYPKHVLNFSINVDSKALFKIDDVNIQTVNSELSLRYFNRQYSRMMDISELFQEDRFFVDTQSIFITK